MRNIFPEYKVLNDLENKFHYSFDPNEFYIISVQHLLESTGSMFESLLRIGFNPSHIYLTGKIYSTHHETQEKLKQLGIQVQESSYPSKLGYYADTLVSDIQKMWKKLSAFLEPNSKIIVLDDGGYALVNVPEDILKNYAVFGIEQTTSGINMVKAKEKFPIIHLASSAAKVIIEPPMVSESVKIQLGAIIEELKPDKIGIIGYGHIGKAIANEFKDTYNIGVFDNKQELKKEELDKNISYYESLDKIYYSSDVIIGATGTDISDMKWLKNSTGDKILISVSSGDIEFNGLLRNCEPYLKEKISNPLQVLKLRTEQNYFLKILRGGMVANFTGSKHSSPGEIIQMTRGLLLSAVMQILRDHKALFTKDNPILLDPIFQKEVVNTWLNDQPHRKKDYSEDDLTGFTNIEWIRKNSL